MNVHAAVQVSGCGECLALSLLQEGSRDTTCVQCEQVGALLSLVVELKEEVKRLRSIWDCEREIDWWSHAQPSMQEAHRGDALQAVGDRLLSPSQVGEGELRDSEGWKQVPVCGSEGTASHPVPLSQVPLHNRFKVLELEGLGGVDVGEGPHTQERLSRGSQTAPRIAIASIRKKRKAVIIGDPLLRRTEDPICLRPIPHGGVLPAWSLGERWC